MRRSWQIDCVAGVFNIFSKLEEATLTGRGLQGSLCRKTGKSTAALADEKKLSENKKAKSLRKSTQNTQCTSPAHAATPQGKSKIPKITGWINRMFIRRPLGSKPASHPPRTYLSEQVSQSSPQEWKTPASSFLEIQPCSEQPTVAKNEYEHLLRIMSKENTPHLFPSMPKSAVFMSGRVRMKNDRLPAFALLVGCRDWDRKEHGPAGGSTARVVGSPREWLCPSHHASPSRRTGEQGWRRGGHRRQPTHS